MTEDEILEKFSEILRNQNYNFNRKFGSIIIPLYGFEYYFTIKTARDNQFHPDNSESASNLEDFLSLVENKKIRRFIIFNLSFFKSHWVAKQSRGDSIRRRRDYM